MHYLSSRCPYNQIIYSQGKSFHCPLNMSWCRLQNLSQCLGVEKIACICQESNNFLVVHPIGRHYYCQFLRLHASLQGNLVCMSSKVHSLEMLFCLIYMFLFAGRKQM